MVSFTEMRESVKPLGSGGTAQPFSLGSQVPATVLGPALQVAPFYSSSAMGQGVQQGTGDMPT